MKKPSLFLPLPLTGLALALLAAYPAQAQSQAQSQATQAPSGVPVLDTVTVTASELSTPLTVVADPKAPDAAPASTGADYLTGIPGFSALRSGGTNGDPVLRGMFGSRLNILSNGASIIGACPGRMDSPASYIAPENFDQVTLVKGPQTVLWGPGASAGTIRFDRDTPRFSAPGVRFDGSVGGGAFDRNDQAIDLTAGTPQFYARLTANHSHSGDYKDGNGKAIPSGWDKWNADLALGFTPNADTLLEVTLGQGDGYAQFAGRGMDGSQLRRETVGARFVKSNLGGPLQKIEAQFYDNYTDMVMDNFTYRTPAAGGMKMASVDNRTTTGGRLAATWRLGQALDLVTGVDAQASRHHQRSGTPMDDYHGHPWVKDASLGNTGAFAEATWHATAHDRVVGGARLDWASAKDWRQNTGSGMSAKPNPTYGEQRNQTLPSGFVRYEQDLTAAPVTWYAGLGHVERFPDYWELFSPKQGPAGTLNAFDGVQPEKTTQIDIGARYKTQQMELWASGYVGYVQDFILFNYGTSSAASNVSASLWGGELGASYRLTPQWRTGATLAYAWGENRTDGSALPQMPPLEARLNVAYENGPWSAGAQWRIVAAQRRIALGQGNVIGRDFGPSAGFGTLSLNASYAFDKHTRLVMGVENLLNKTYSEHLNTAGNAVFGFPAQTSPNQPGRTLWAKVNARF